MIKMKIFLKLAILSLLFLTNGCSVISENFEKLSLWENERATNRVNELAQKNENVAKLDELCKQVPIPPSFVFGWKRIIRDDSKSLSYYFFSTEDVNRVKNDLKESLIPLG